MLKYKFVICDDEPEKANILKSIYKDDYYEIIHLSSLRDLNTYIVNQTDLDAIFLDLYYRTETDKELVPITYEEVVKIKKAINKKSKIIIYTQFTSKRIDLLTRLTRERIIAEWIDFNELSNSETAEPAILRINNCIGIGSQIENGIWLLHLSDLHFGRQFEFATEEIGQRLVRLIRDQIKDNLKEDSTVKIDLPKLILLSGDFTDSAEESQFEESLKFINSLRESFLKIKSFNPIPIIAPGNHDFNWRLSLIEEYGIEKDERSGSAVLKETPTDNSYIKMVKWRPFLEKFQREFEQATHKSKTGRWWIYDLTKTFGCRIFVFNTSFDMNFKKAKVDILPSHIEEMENSIEDDDYLGIFVTHHPVSEWGDETTQKELLKLLHSRLSIRIIFSGHKHNDNIIPHRIEVNKKCLEIRTGSISVHPNARGAWDLPSYRIVQIAKDEDRAWRNVISWTFFYDKGSFFPKPLSSSGLYYESEDFQ